nr:M81 family metallopeptidase [Paenibacillus bovis]
MEDLRILVGCLYHESNTFNPFYTTENDFVLVEGEDMLERVASTEVFQEYGVDIIPSIYAVGLSSGTVLESAYRFFADKILEVIKREGNLDAIWLHLHGSMTVEGVGSAELQLLKEIREIVGSDIPIAVCLDIHANNSLELPKYANIIRSYRTVPHIDQRDTEMITAKLLVKSVMDRMRVRPVFKRLPLIIDGDSAVGAREPLKSIFKRLEEMEKVEGIVSASFFVGFSWADTENTASSIVVIPQSEDYEELADKMAEELAAYVFSRRYDFEFDALALNPEHAVRVALDSGASQVFISDTGDNTTGGAPGINTILLESLLSQQDFRGKKVCIASILDEEAYTLCDRKEIGDTVQVNIGIGYDENSKSISVSGRIKAKGDLLGYLGSTYDKVGKVCTLTIGNNNHLDVVIANKAGSFISLQHFIAAGLNVFEYDVVVVKQGYLFDELSKISKLDIFALTPGATYQHFEELDFKNIPRPLFPFDTEIAFSTMGM